MRKAALVCAALILAGCNTPAKLQSDTGAVVVAPWEYQDYCRRQPAAEVCSK